MTGACTAAGITQVDQTLAITTDPGTAQIGTYVALGDSYSSGEGVAPYFEPKNKCHRSTAAYPTKVDIPFTQEPYEALSRSWGFLACSGAQTLQVLDKQVTTKREKGDTNWLPLSSSTRLVTITAGGDDMNFAGVLSFCYKMGHDCENEIFPRGSSTTLNEWASDQLATLKINLISLYQQVRARAKNAQLLVLGYPQLLPASTAEQRCIGLLPQLRTDPGLEGDEQTFLRSEDDQLNTTIADAVSAANVDATFLPVAAAFAGHEVCGTLGQWINGPSLTGMRHYPFFTNRTTSFHPNRLGQDEYGAIVNQYLDGE